ncbi:BOI-related E3 ubiquitin-protein ligase 1-like isoform X2 [Amaranthus tricolor]|uniref:BOI-related E3 ubiquitin-protein ligase 1-like isoform X2 n=1 Tax=Amaranthus tricolor TaxID=29722 RepID=UPI00258FDF0A|nr:BOI-related E3 ubiquitin-protein ligase 1-like isoform X2 [Amaranthus tricolor]
MVMAVQAQYPSNVLLLNRNVQDTNDFSLQNQHGGGVTAGFIEPSHTLFNNHGVVGLNPRKRSREVGAATTTTTVDSFNFSLQNQQQNQNQSHQFIDLTQLQNHQQSNVVSTGLRLSFDEQNHQLQQQQQIQQQPNNTILSPLSEEFSLQFKQQSDEITYFLHTQGEHLRRTLADKRQRYYRALVGAAEETVARRMKEKEAEIEKAARRIAELEARAAQLTLEAQSWQVKARAQEAQAANLQAQLQQAMVGPTNVNGGDKEGSGVGCNGDAEDAESAYVDPVSDRRVPSPSCKMCRTRVATVVLLPCRHLCVCRECDDVVQACPLCLSMRTASIEVYLA